MVKMVFQKIRKLSENQFFIFFKQKNNFARFLQLTFSKGFFDLCIVCKNFRYVAQTVQMIWQKQCSKKIVRKSVFIFWKQKNSFVRLLQLTFIDGLLEVYLVQKFQTCNSNGLEDMAKMGFQKYENYPKILLKKIRYTKSS